MERWFRNVAAADFIIGGRHVLIAFSSLYSLLTLRDIWLKKKVGVGVGEWKLPNVSSKSERMQYHFPPPTILYFMTRSRWWRMRGPLSRLSLAVDYIRWFARTCQMDAWAFHPWRAARPPSSGRTNNYTQLFYHHISQLTRTHKINRKIVSMRVNIK